MRDSGYNSKIIAILDATRALMAFMVVLGQCGAGWRGGEGRERAHSTEPEQTAQLLPRG